MLNGSKIFTLRNSASGELTTFRLQVLTGEGDTPTMTALLNELAHLVRQTVELCDNTIEHECFVGGLPAPSEN